jgi:hypothetical protein
MALCDAQAGRLRYKGMRRCGWALMRTTRAENQRYGEERLQRSVDADDGAVCAVLLPGGGDRVFD